MYINALAKPPKKTSNCKVNQIQQAREEIYWKTKNIPFTDGSNLKKCSETESVMLNAGLYKGQLLI